MSQYGFSTMLLLDIVIKVSFLLLVVWVGSLFMRKRSAAAQHRWWTLGFVGSLLIPAITFVTPTWTLPILPRTTAITDPSPIDSIPLASNRVFVAPTPKGLVERSPERGLPPKQQSLLHDELGNTTDEQPIDAMKPSAGGPETTLIPNILVMVWALGIAICWLRIVWQHALLKRIMNDCLRLGNPEWKDLLNNCAQSLKLKQRVSLLRHPSAHSPVSTGLRHPAVILPEDAENWNVDRRRLVLLHELAHVQRRDVLTQTMAGMASGLYWFNPLCWYGLVQMRKFRELACDDLVLSCGQQPSGYADVLLGIARSYCHKSYPTAVGMAHGTNIEGRIMAILDKTRRHVSLSRRAAGLLLSSAAALVLFVGTAQLRSQAEPSSTPKVVGSSLSESQGDTPQKADTANRDDQPVDQFRTMEVRITDDAGRPLEKARLHVSVWYTKGYQGKKIPKEYMADAEGIVNLKIPRRLLILRLWPSKAGYVPEFTNFSQGSHDEGRLIPNRYEFQLSKGTRLSGTVIDEIGQPVSGVTVDVSVEVPEPAWGVNPKSMISTWLTDEDFNEGSAITDKDGKWWINNAPEQTGKNDFEFRLKFTHKDYASDGEYGELQTQQEITTKLLRNGTAKIVLSRGKPVTGVVVDSSGNAVTDGFVVWRGDSYSDAKKFEAKIDDLGRFVTTPLPPGKHPFTVISPGFLPVHRKVHVKADMADLHIDLQPGNQLKVKVVDPAGNPIPRAYFHVGSWRSVEPEFNGGQSSVFQARIPRNADENGVFSWDGAPKDAVTYRISARNFISKTVTLIATEQEHVVELSPSLVVSGEVTDANTGKLIESFRVLPVIVRSKRLSTWHLGAVAGKAGLFEIKLDGFSDSQNYKIRLEAGGYRSQVSEATFNLSSGRVQENFSLLPAAPRRGIVLSENGRPVAGASVVQATPSVVPSMQDAVLGGGWSGRVIHTSENGSFRLAATSEPVLIRVTHELGFAEVIRQSDEAIGTIKLQSWAKISGRLLQAGKPIPNELIFFSPISRGKIGDPRFQDSYRVQTDADGRFEFERLPPIAGSVRASLGPWRDSPLTSSLSIPVNLKPGEQKILTLGGKGTTLRGQVRATGRGDAELSRQWSLNYLISRDRGIEMASDSPRLGFNPDGPVQSSWFLDQGFHGWLSSRENYFVKLTPDGQLEVSGVPPGSYDLFFQLYEQPAGCLVETVGEKVVSFEITDSDLASGIKDLGTVEVECRAGPRVGENMQLYSFTDPKGRERTIKQMEGRCIVMHVWASWCAPCIEHLSDVEGTIESLSEQPVTFVGLNVDQDSAQAEELAKRKGWTWSQNYVGDDSDIARQLAISSVPTYYLIGPDGLLIASATEWSKIKKELLSSLDETGE